MVFLILKNTELIKILKQEKRTKIDSEDFNFIADAEIQFPKNILGNRSVIVSLSMPDGSMGLSFFDDRIIVISYGIASYSKDTSSSQYVSEAFINLALYCYYVEDKQWSIPRTVLDFVELGRIPFSQRNKSEGKLISRKAMSCIKRCSTLEKSKLVGYLKSLSR